jgi:hypothetical protein
MRLGSKRDIDIGDRSHGLPASVTIRIRYRILNAGLAAGAVSGGGVDQAYDGWRVVSQFEFQQWVVESGHSLKPPGAKPVIRSIKKPQGGKPRSQ